MINIALKTIDGKLSSVNFDNVTFWEVEKTDLDGPLVRQNGPVQCTAIYFVGGNVRLLVQEIPETIDDLVDSAINRQIEVDEKLRTIEREMNLRLIGSSSKSTG